MGNSPTNPLLAFDLLSLLTNPSLDNSEDGLVVIARQGGGGNNQGDKERKKKRRMYLTTHRPYQHQERGVYRVGVWESCWRRRQSCTYVNRGLHRV